jgi:hypothetical protein
VANVNDTLNVIGPTLTKTIGPSPAIEHAVDPHLHDHQRRRQSSPTAARVH